MEPVDRLAAMLDGELSPDETAALEAELAGKPALAAELAALRRADAVLDTLPATEEPAGFADRLAERLAPEVAATIGRTAPAVASRRRTPRWAFSGAAAGLLLLGGTAVVLLGGPLGGGDDAVSTMLADDLEMAPSEAPTADRTPAIAGGPVVVTADRELDPAAIDELLTTPALQAVAARALAPSDGRELASRWRIELDTADALFAAPQSAPESGQADELADGLADGLADAAPMEESAVAESDAAGAAEPVLGADDGADDVEAALLRCLDVVLASDPDAIPVYLEVARFDGEPALVYGLVTIDPTTGAYTRPEVWVVDRASCEPRRFVQDTPR